jgi:hypothetical protein
VTNHVLFALAAVCRKVQASAAKSSRGENIVMKNFTRIALAVSLLSIGLTAAAEDYSFKVTNNTDTAIKKILVSQDGEEYGFFNIGAGIKPGQTVTLVWDSSTNGESCDQFFKAVLANGEESEASEFNFCESEVALEFE